MTPFTLLLLVAVTLADPPTSMGTHRSACWNGALLSDKKFEMASRNFPLYSCLEDSRTASIASSITHKLSSTEYTESRLPTRRSGDRSSAIDPRDAECFIVEGSPTW